MPARPRHALDHEASSAGSSFATNATRSTSCCDRCDDGIRVSNIACRPGFVPGRAAFSRTTISINPSPLRLAKVSFERIVSQRIHAACGTRDYPQTGLFWRGIVYSQGDVCEQTSEPKPADDLRLPPASWWRGRCRARPIHRGRRAALVAVKRIRTPQQSQLNFWTRRFNRCSAPAAGIRSDCTRTASPCNALHSTSATTTGSGRSGPSAVTNASNAPRRAVGVSSLANLIFVGRTNIASYTTGCVRAKSR